MIDLNILKIVGAFVAGVAGIIGILGETRTEDKKLTRYGKWLFGMAIIGVMLAVSTQIWEWHKSLEDDRIARKRNEALLVRLDKEAELATQSLHEIRRAVTRFQTITLSFSYHLDSTDQLFGPYIRDLTKLAEDANRKGDLAVGEESDDGLIPLVVNSFGEANLFRIVADSPAMPDEKKYTLARHYILEAVPKIFLFRNPIAPTSFFASYPHERPEPDLILKPDLGKVSITFVLREIDPKVGSITVQRNMNASVFFSSGAIVSLEDLSGSQAIMSLESPREFRELWNKIKSYDLKCFINSQRIGTSKLTPTQVAGQLIYSFTFPSVSPTAAAKIKN